MTVTKTVDFSDVCQSITPMIVVGQEEVCEKWKIEYGQTQPTICVKYGTRFLRCKLKSYTSTSIDVECDDVIGEAGYVTVIVLCYDGTKYSYQIKTVQL